MHAMLYILTSKIRMSTKLSNFLRFHVKFCDTSSSLCKERKEALR